MPDVSGPEQAKNSRKARIYRERDEFIKSIPTQQVLDLASSYCDSKHCSFFREAVNGSYNVCFFVQFDHGPRWVVRVPIAPRLVGQGREKLEREVASMRLVSEKTTIPLPRIVAYKLDSGRDPLSSFVILEYADGRRLSFAEFKALPDEPRTGFYTSLADTYIQLRRLEFPAIGRLMCRGEGRFEVAKRTATIDINRLEQEGLCLGQIQASYSDPNGALHSANSYVSMLLEIASHVFAQGHDLEGESVADDEDTLYHLDLFRRYAEQWVDQSLDNGPFVLVHGDLELFNLLVDDSMNITAVLDWEWSQVAPRQFFLPPLWLGIPDTTKLAYDFVYKDYLKYFDGFLSVVRSRERECFGEELLAEEWERAKVDSGFLVANALESSTDMDWFANRYVGWKWYRGSRDLADRVRAFIDEDPARSLAIANRRQKANVHGAIRGRDADDDPLLLDRGGRTGEETSSHSDAETSPLGIVGYLRHKTKIIVHSLQRTTSFPTTSHPRLVMVSVAILLTGTSYLLQHHLIATHLRRRP